MATETWDGITVHLIRDGCWACGDGKGLANHSTDFRQATCVECLRWECERLLNATLTAAEDARENIISGTTGRTAPDLDSDGNDQRLHLAGGCPESFEIGALETEQTADATCLACLRNTLKATESREARFWTETVRLKAVMEEAEPLLSNVAVVERARFALAEARQALGQASTPAPEPPRPDLYDLLAGWALDRDDPRTLGMLLRALVDRAAREDGR